MDKEFLSRNITLLRKERGWSQEKLAQEANVSYHTVFRAEAGTKPRTENLQRIARALGVSETQLLHGENQVREHNSKADLLTEIYSIAPTLHENQLKEVLTKMRSFGK